MNRHAARLAPPNAGLLGDLIPATGRQAISLAGFELDAARLPAAIGADRDLGRWLRERFAMSKVDVHPLEVIAVVEIGQIDGPLGLNVAPIVGKGGAELLVEARPAGVSGQRAKPPL